VKFSEFNFSDPGNFPDPYCYPQPIMFLPSVPDHGYLDMLLLAIGVTAVTIYLLVSVFNC